MNGFALPLAGFTAMNVALLVAMFWRAWDDVRPERAALTWAVTCPLAGMFFGIGMPLPALVAGAVSVLALGVLAHWYLAPASDDGDDGAEEPVEPEPGPSDDIVLEPPRDDGPDDTIDWDEFDRLRAGWDRERDPLPEPERV
jgi:hypothetical protein